MAEDVSRELLHRGIIRSERERFFPQLPCDRECELIGDGFGVCGNS